MADFGFLSNPASAQVQSPDLLRMAGQAMTLGSMAQNQQMQALQLQKLQDAIGLYGSPQGAAILQSILGGGQPGQPGGGTQIPPDFLENHPGAPEFLQSMMAMAKEQAGTELNRTQAAKNIDETQRAGLSSLGSIASNFLRNPNQSGWDSIQRQIDYNAKLGRPPETYTSPLDPNATPDQVFAWAGNLANLSTSPKDQADIGKIAFDQWAKTAEEKRLWFTMNKPEIKTLPSGEAVRISPYATPPEMPPPPGQAPSQPTAQWNGPGPTPAAVSADAAASGAQILPPRPMGAAVGSGVQGTGVQLEPSVTQKVNLEVAKPELGQLIAGSQAATGMKAMLEDLRNQEAQGIYSGGIQGQPAFKQMANVLAAAHLLSPQQVATLANTQNWDVESKNLVAQAVKQFVGGGGRVAARELDFMGKAKPEDLQTPEGREIIYNTLWKISDRINQQATQAQQHFNDTGELGTFTPKFVNNTMPNPVVPGLPDPATKAGWSAKAADGTIYKSDGTRWIRQ